MKKNRTNLIIFCILSVIVVVLLFICFRSNMALNDELQRNQALSEALGNQQNLTNTISLQVEDLNEEKLALSYTVTAQDKELADYEAMYIAETIPDGYPVKGASLISDEEDSEITDSDNNEMQIENEDTDSNDALGDENGTDEEQYVRFVCNIGSTIVASARGTVTSIVTDDSYGTIITIDHGNGYLSIYKVMGEVLVEEGDTVSKGCNLVKVSVDKTLFYYEIELNEKYIDPMTCLLING